MKKEIWVIGVLILASFILMFTSGNFDKKITGHSVTSCTGFGDDDNGWNDGDYDIFLDGWIETPGGITLSDTCVDSNTVCEAVCIGNGDYDYECKYIDCGEGYYCETQFCKKIVCGDGECTGNENEENCGVDCGGSANPSEGFSSGGYCWYANPGTSDSCDKICADHGGSVGEAVDTNCAVQKAFGMSDCNTCYSNSYNVCPSSWIDQTETSTTEIQ